MLSRLYGTLYQLVTGLAPRRILDFGCGEAHFWGTLARFGPLPEVLGIDLRPDAIAAATMRYPAARFLCIDLFELPNPDPSFDLVIASEVLEHLRSPDRYLARLCELSTRWVLLTVPHEPFFRLCNFARGRDLRRFGNHPEHIQCWSKRSFGRFVSAHLEIVRLETSFPFVILLGRVRDAK
ncbi:class I SAM-dependent methyltransferase [Singulisphaera sp. Ch08]|uniref:class I SAM-dependent methyltransferase n=1 Tax=Singulisphaera sp. Ch08 TaxID=3120278 RepID=UPI003872F7DE